MTYESLLQSLALDVKRAAFDDVRRYLLIVGQCDHELDLVEAARHGCEPKPASRRRNRGDVVGGLRAGDPTLNQTRVG